MDINPFYNSGSFMVIEKGDYDICQGAGPLQSACLLGVGCRRVANFSAREDVMLSFSAVLALINSVSATHSKVGPFE